MGVVSIENLDPPDPPVSYFLFDLMLDPMAGGNEDDDDVWGSSWANNGLYELEQAQLVRRAHNWADSLAISPTSRAAALTEWIDSLPWRDTRLTLHLGN